MRYPIHWSALLALVVALFSFQVEAGGRYQNPPENINEVIAEATKAQDFLAQGNLDEALTSTREARRLAKESNKFKTTAPMQRASSKLRMARSAIKKGDSAKATALLEELTTYLDGVVQSYQ